MVVVKRNQILIVALFILVVVAGVCNFVDTSDKTNEILEETEKIFRESSIALKSADLNEEVEKESVSTKIDTSVESEEENIENTEDIGLATLVSTSENEFFLEAKINRDETREERKELLMEVINTVAQTDASKENAMNEIVEIQNIMEKEMQIESLIEAKGFGSTYVRIDDKQVDIVVSKQNLNQNEIAQIVDITERETGLKSSQIKISSLKLSE